MQPASAPSHRGSFGTQWLGAYAHHSAIEDSNGALAAHARDIATSLEECRVSLPFRTLQGCTGPPPDWAGAECGSELEAGLLAVAGFPVRNSP